MNLIMPDFEQLKKKINYDEVTRKLYDAAIAYADMTVMAEFPSEPIKEHGYIKKIDGRYTDKYLGILQEYDLTSWLYERAFRNLAFAYKMTGNRKYLDKFEEAIDRCLLNPWWGPENSEYDHCSSRILRSLYVSLSWLGSDLSRDHMERITKRMKKEVIGFEEKYSRMGDDYPIGPNDHQSKDLSGAGCAAWFLSKNDPAMKLKLQRFVSLFSDKLIDETIGDDGGWPDGCMCVLYALMDAISFIEVIKESTGKDLTQHPKLKRTCDFFIGTIPLHNRSVGEEKTPVIYPYIHAMFWMASMYRREDIQFVARNAVISGMADLDFSAYAFICYDETLKAQEYSGNGVLFTKSVGWGRLGWGNNADSVYLWLKSGPADAFCRNNQNGILLTAFGRQLFSDVTLPKVGYQKLWKCVYEEGLWTTKCATALLVNGHNQKRNRYGEDWGPIMKFHNPNREKWGDEDAWWFDFEEPKAPLGRIAGGWCDDNTAVIKGRADRCYGDLLSGYTRTCIMTRDGLIIIVDLIIPNENTKDFQFRANSSYTFSVKDKSRAAIFAREVRSDILFLYNGDFNISAGEWPFNPGTGSYLTGDFKVKDDEKARLITILKPYRDNNEHALNAWIDRDYLTVVFDNDEHKFDLKSKQYNMGGNDEHI